MKCNKCNNANVCLDHVEIPSLSGCTSGIPDRKVPTNADKIRNMSDKAEVKKQEAHCEYVKNKIAAEYPDALDYSTAKPFIIWLCDSDDYDGTFESDGVKYKFKETEDLHGNKVLSIISTGKKNPDTKVIKIDDNLEAD